MGRMVGADVAELERLASAMERGATQLSGISQTVRRGVEVSGWIGNVATRFRVDWASQHSRVLAQAADDLRQAAQHVREQAEQQREASSATHGAATGLSSAPWAQGRQRDPSLSLLGLWEASRDSMDNGWVQSITGVLGAGTVFGANSSLVGRYAKNDLWASTRYKKTFSGLFGGRIFSVNGPWHQLSQYEAVGQAGRIFGWAGIASSVEDYLKDPSVGNALTVVESGLKSSKHPVTYLAGMAMSSVHLAADKGMETDWSAEARQTVAEAIESDGFYDIVVLGVADGITKFATNDIWKVF